MGATQEKSGRDAAPAPATNGTAASKPSLKGGDVKAPASEDSHSTDVEAGRHSRPKLGDNFRYNSAPGFLRRLLFLDVDPLIHLGYRTRLEPHHLCKDASVQTAVLMANLEPGWAEQRKKPVPDLKMALLRGNVRGIVFTGVLYLIAQACSLAGPLLLREIVGGLQCFSAQRKYPGVQCKDINTLY
jgi:hypothetical protein